MIFSQHFFSLPLAASWNCWSCLVPSRRSADPISGWTADWPSGQQRSRRVTARCLFLNRTGSWSWITAVLKPNENSLIWFEGQKLPVFAVSRPLVCVCVSNWQQRLLAASRLSCTGTMRSPNGCFPPRCFTPRWLSELNCLLQEINPSSPLHGPNHILNASAFLARYLLLSREENFVFC